MNMTNGFSSSIQARGNMMLNTINVMNQNPNKT